MWEKGWENDAQVSQLEPEMAYDPSKIHRIEFNGKYHKMSGFFQTHPSPQRTPVIFQAGASKSGIAFAGKHSEAIYTDYATFSDLKNYTRQVREAAVAAGRDPTTIKIFAAMMPILGKTQAEAEAKYAKIDGLISGQGGMAKFSGFTGVDRAQYKKDEEFQFDGKPGDNIITGAVNGFKTAAEVSTVPWTPEYLGHFCGFGGPTPKPCGTPEVVADYFEECFNECDIDGFNLVCKCFPMFPLLSKKLLLTKRTTRLFESNKLRRCCRFIGPGVAKAWIDVARLPCSRRVLQGELAEQTWQAASGKGPSRVPVQVEQRVGRTIG